MRRQPQSLVIWSTISAIGISLSLAFPVFWGTNAIICVDKEYAGFEHAPCVFQGNFSRCCFLLPRALARATEVLLGTPMALLLARNTHCFGKQ